jgi:hypothetical protein
LEINWKSNGSNPVVAPQSDSEDDERHHSLDKWIEALTQMVGDEDQEDFYENLPESNDFHKQRDNEKSNRGHGGQNSSRTEDSDDSEDECETPREVLAPLPKKNDPKVPQENEKYFEKKNYVRTDKYDLGLLHKLMPLLPSIVGLFGDIK